MLLFIAQNLSEFLKSGAFGFVAIAMKQRQAKENAFFVFKAPKVCTGGAVKHGFGAIIRVRAPTYVMQVAGGLDQAQLFRFGGFENRKDEPVERFTKAWNASIFGFHKAASFDHRVTCTDAIWHLFIKHTFADAIGTDCDVMWFKATQHTFEHFNCQWHQRHSRAGHTAAGPQLVWVMLLDIAGSVAYSGGGHAVFVKNFERIAAALHVNAGNGTPGAANQK
mmetsp:Transcript_2592/g.4435  ORF Transcript_2592/g.4435 Transcript_2592/m.4435 type:complete len:222 (-) Transcript_2592:705-1370(-)